MIRSQHAYSQRRGRFVRKRPPHFIQGLILKAARYYRAGRLAEAERIYRQALQIDAQRSDCLHALAIILQLQGRLDEAVATYRRVLTLRPDCAEVHSNLGVALMAQGRAMEAFRHHQHAVTLNPTDANAHHNLGIALEAQGDLTEAMGQYQRVLRLNPNHADAHNSLGNLLKEQGNFVDAIAHYEKVLVINAKHAEAHNNLGNIFAEQGKFDDAMRHYDRATAIKPDYAEAHFHRAEIKSFRNGDYELAALKKLSKAGRLSANQSIYIHFALAKALDDTGDYRQAFEHLRAGNVLKRQQIKYDESHTFDLFRRTMKVFDNNLFERFQETGDPSPTPIFVLGMPRSGSTLVEQILSSHPQVQAAGELLDLELATRSVLNASSQPGQYPDCIPGLDHEAFRVIGQFYLSRLPALAGGRVRIVDKFPGNFLMIGLIRLILPNAKIIHTVRDPIDTCLSCYSKLFRIGLPFSYDLEELGRYYHSYSKLMAHWHAVLPPGAMLDFSYEDLVNDLEGQTRRLIDYCNLPWDDRCLSFHKTERIVRTASAAQVRKPLFRTSLQRWRRHEPQLAPLLRALQDGIPASGCSTN